MSSFDGVQFNNFEIRTDISTLTGRVNKLCCKWLTGNGSCSTRPFPGGLYAS